MKIKFLRAWQGVETAGKYYKGGETVDLEDTNMAQILVDKGIAEIPKSVKKAKVKDG